MRQAILNDLPAAEALLKDGVRHLQACGIDQWDDIYPTGEDLAEDQTRGELYVEKRDGALAGVVTLTEARDEQYANGRWRTQEPSVVVHRLCVSPALQHSGVARGMMRSIETWAKERGYRSIRLDCFPPNAAAMRLYASLGYRKCGEVHWRKGAFDLMEKGLEAVEIRPLTENERTAEALSAIDRTQVVTHCWRKERDEWVVREVPFTEHWNEKDYQALSDSLNATLRRGGTVIGLIVEGEFKGEISVEGKPMRLGTLELESLHISTEYRGRGFGRLLFQAGADWARSQGAAKLYLSAHSSVESQAFYRAMGCAPSPEPEPAHVAKEPCDVQMEFAL